MFANFPFAGMLGLGMAALVAALVVNAVRNIFLHPLSKFPGPKLYAASRIPYIVSLLRGSLAIDHAAIHRKYGPIVRVAPNELSFTTVEAWNDIYVHRPGHIDPAKDPVWYKAPEDMPQNIVTALDPKTHSRMRKALAPSFTENALRDQASTIDRYASLLVSRLREVVTSTSESDGAIVDIVQWMSFFAADTIGDLAFGDSFQCLENGQLHDWVKTLNQFLRGMVYAATTRWYPLAEKLLMKMVPQRVMEMQKQHSQFANEKINKRLGLETQRNDFMTPFLAENVEMSLQEIQSNFAILIVAGADATTTTLSGTLLYLVKNVTKLEKLKQEIRSKFTSAEDINVSSTANLPYLGAVIDEGLRLSNPVPGGLPRLVPKGGDYYAGRFVPEGVSISVRPYAMSRSEENFKDPDNFVPERWLERETGRYSSDNLAASQPFGIGHSNCLGRKLAWAEIRVVLAGMMFEFDLEESASEQDWKKLKTYMIIDKGRIEIRCKLRGSF